VRAIGGLRKQLELGVESKVESSTPRPHTWHSPIGGFTGRLNSPIGGLTSRLKFKWWVEGEMRLTLGPQHQWELSINGRLWGFRLICIM